MRMAELAPKRCFNWVTSIAVTAAFQDATTIEKEILTRTMFTSGWKAIVITEDIFDSVITLGLTPKRHVPTRL